MTKKAKKANNDIADGDGNHQIIQVVCMPSVSPAAASFTYSQKRDAWEKGCYNTGLKDYEEWRQNNELESNKQLCQTPKRKVAVDESFLTPISSKKSKSKTKSPKLRTPSSSSTKASIGPRIVSSDIAKLSPENEWIDLQVPPEELRPSATLTNGQCFNWIVVHSYLDENEGVDSVPATPNSAWGTHNAKEWVGPLQNRVFSIRETTTTTQYRVLHGPTEGAHEYLQHYFRLETKLAPLYAEWSKADSRLSTIAKCIPGVRILRQEPLVSQTFILYFITQDFIALN